MKKELFKTFLHKKLYTAIVLGCILVYMLWMEQSRLYLNSNWRHIYHNEQEGERLEDRPLPKKVLLYTYMRGGSSYFGEIFHHNPDAVYWFEPMDSFYQAHFGMRPLVKPLNTFYYTNQTERNISNLELQKIVQFHQNMFNCEYSRLPPTVFGNIHNSKSSLEFAHCGVTSESLSNCLKMMTGICSAKIVPDVTKDPMYTNVGHSVKNHCLAKITAAFDGHPLMIGAPDEPAIFANYTRCLENIRQSFLEKGYERLKKSCKSKNLQAIKNIRLTMDITRQLMEEIPDMKLIYYVRDPRGIISSRMAVNGLFTFQPLVETKVLCQRMAKDLQIFREMDKLMPGRVILQKYEEFAKNPEAETQRTYDLLQEPAPVTAIDWIRLASSNFKNKKVNKIFGTIRKNSTDVSIAWKTQLPESLRTQLTEICAEVIQQFNYEL